MIKSQNVDKGFAMNLWIATLVLLTGYCHIERNEVSKNGIFVGFSPTTNFKRKWIKDFGVA